MKLIRKNVENVYSSFFDDFLTRDLFSRSVSNWNDSPAVNVSQDDDSYGIELAAPGLKKENFNIEVKNDVLTISYEDKQESEEKDDNGKYTRREFSFNAFTRSFTLPDRTVDEENVVANYTDGVLKVVLPKLEETKPKAPRTISVS